MRDLALAQMQITKDKGIDFFNDYRKAMFPWIETAKVREGDQQRKLLEHVVKMGPLSVKSMGTKPLKSRLVRQIDRKLTEEQRRGQNELYKRLGKSLPI